MTALRRAMHALEGLSVGDAFGQCFFQQGDGDNHLGAGELPPAPWFFTDDTLMALSVVDQLARHGRIEQDELALDFAARYDYDRAYGPSMHRVLARIGNGEPWRAVATGGFEGQGSWGNGAAMRVAPLGAFFADDLAAAKEQAARSAEITHAHPEGVAGAVAVALASALAVRARAAGTPPSPAGFLEEIVSGLPPSEVRSRIARARSITSADSVQFAVSVLGNGVGMSAQDTVPYALWCAAHSLDDFARALWATVAAGGDRDTMCAIAGGVVASFTGADGIPAEWRARREPLPDWFRHALTGQP